MEHFPGGGLSVYAPPVDSSLTRGFRAEGIPFQSNYGVSPSYAPANGGTDVAYSPLYAVLCVCTFSIFGACLCALHVLSLRMLFRCVHKQKEGGLYSMQITLPVLQQLLLCVGPSVSC